MRNNSSKHKVAIIGSGISGLSAAQLLTARGYTVTVYEKTNSPGGLIKCSVEDGVLFHRVGGHVFNTKNQEVMDWFFSFFDKEKDFILSDRNAQIWMNNEKIGYPIENYLYQINPELVAQIVEDLTKEKSQLNDEISFEEFLKNNFGSVLYHLYFEPYNQKIWNSDMAQIPLPWLAGKLPMPKRNEIFINNILRNKEKDMVHKQFFYPLKGGSAFFIDKLINNIDIKYNCEVTEITTQKDGKLTINNRTYDSIIYTGDIRNLNKIIPTTEMDNGDIQNLKSNGTTTVLCQSEPSNLSWLYIPELKYKAHRIIYTGNFSPANNGNRTLTCTVEFSGKMNLDEINRELSLLPGNLLPIAFNYEPNSYVVQNFNTRDIIQSAKDKLNNQNIYLLGRFAEWEYYNMDKAIEAAMVLINSKY